MSSDTKTGNGGATIVLADDSRVMRKAITRALANEFTIIEAEDGERAWAQLEAHPETAVLISDIEMPNTNGFELLDRIRNASETHLQTLPVIMLTGAEDEATRREALAHGATDFVIKPIDSIELLARVRNQAKASATARNLLKAASTLEEESTLDPLTQITSKRFFMQRAEQDIAYAMRRHHDISILRIDIDHFKKIYVQHGDEIADQILIWVAHAILPLARVEDTLARVGGEEFAILAPSTSPAQAISIGERVRSTIGSRPFIQNHLSIEMTVSIGIAALSEGKADDIDGLVRIAEKRLKSARRAGGNRILGPQTAAASAAIIPDTPSDHEEHGLALMDDAPMTEEVVEEQTATASIDSMVAASMTASEIGFGDTLELEHAHLDDRYNEPAELSEPIEPVSVDAALALIAAEQYAPLSPHIKTLLTELLPLLEYADNSLRLDLGPVLEKLRQKLGEQPQHPGA